MAASQAKKHDWATIEPEIDGKPCWERLKNERYKAYGAFQIFRDLPMFDRTFEKVGHVLCENQGIPLQIRGGRDVDPNRKSKMRPPKKVMDNLRRWSKEYLWHQRLEHYDTYMDRMRMEENKKAAQDMIQRHLTISALLQQKAVKRLKEMDDSKLDPRHVLTYLVEGAKLERLARGEPTEVSETRGNGAAATKDEVDEAVASARDMLNSRLKAIQERTREREQREKDREAAKESREEEAENRTLKVV